MSPRPLGRRIAAVSSGLIVALSLAACTTHPSPEVAVRSFLLAWQDGNYAEAARHTTGDPAQVEQALADVHDQLDLASIRFDLGQIATESGTANAEFGVNADLGIGDPMWNYTGQMSLTNGAAGWQIDWSPSVIHPELGEGERLAVSYEIEERGQILDRSGEPLVAADSVTAFGVLPADMEDKEAGVTELAELLDEDPDPLLNRVRSAPPEQFQPLVLMRDADNSLLREAGNIAGVDTQEIEVNLSPRVAPFLLGEVAGTAEHRVSSRVAGPYQAGDTVGLSGLQNIFQQELAGTATTQVVSLGEDGEQTDVLESWEGVRSGGIETTLDLAVQSAAENALETVPGDGYIVAVDTSSGEVLAAANASGSVTDDGAFTGSYAPGGTFTMVSALAALDSGAVTADSEMPCGWQSEIGDQTFTNPSGGSVVEGPTLVRNMAYLCTVGFVDVASEVGAGAITEAATQLGMGADWQLPLPVSSGAVDIADGDEAEVAAAMVGDHGVQVSPLSMALAAGAVADGSWHGPTLVREEGPAPAGTNELDEAHLEVVREGLRDAVSLRIPEMNVGEEQVFGQAARAEQGDTALHWFVGYQGDVAFAVLAEVDPETSLWQQYAVTAATSFLNGLAHGSAEGEGLLGEEVPELPVDAPVEGELNAPVEGAAGEMNPEADLTGN
ncbi:penicillin-binding transpeptidase domain-containing protein [Nocardiopsis exhalans]|uniref:Penicillin-binding transpeptidase domain-containing protein n=1 Tax=Nocardiopsis exhalans TaxID=163604 RepID=A0ABY5D5P8_9ACTN|nr:penicillin-binding transpeptidase domain-containing protein [Nocardiopsis exhalans]USY19056.1 penicillin-binding transpeptidase domain-containing protein [Nocardiopsis exhalans]